MITNEAEVTSAEVFAMEDTRYAAMTSGDLDATPSKHASKSRPV